MFRVSLSNVVFCSVDFFYPIRLGFTQMDHSIEDRTAEATFDLLVGKAPCLQLVADEVLIAINLRFGQRASMIATGLFPPLASFLSHGSKDLIARQRRGLAVAMLLDYSVFAQRDDRPNRGLTRRRGQRVEHLLFVIGPIPAYRPHRLVDLAQQRSNLRGIIDPDGMSTSGRPPRRWPR